MKIEITAVPDGEASLALRGQWVGIVLPVDQKKTGLLVRKLGADPVSVISLGRVASGHRDCHGFSVLIDDCLAALRTTGRNDAADQWEELRKSWPPTKTQLVFDRKCCRVVDPPICVECGENHRSDQ